MKTKGFNGLVLSLATHRVDLPNTILNLLGLTKVSKGTPHSLQSNNTARAEASNSSPHLPDSIPFTSPSWATPCRRRTERVSVHIVEVEPRVRALTSAVSQRLLRPATPSDLPSGNHGQFGFKRHGHWTSHPDFSRPTVVG